MYNSMEFNFSLTNIDWGLVIDILQSLSVIVASFVAIYSVNSWRNEAKWKRRYELAEEVLANLYESQQAIRYIRNPIGHQDEGKTRKVNDNETPEQTEALNQAFAVRERYNRSNKSLQKLHALKYRFIALFGKEYEVHFDKFNQVIKNIFFAADEIAYIRLGHYDDDKELKINLRKEYKETIYANLRGKENDKIENEIQFAVDKIEDVCRKVIGKI
jgi:hypothetical protein